MKRILSISILFSLLCPRAGFATDSLKKLAYLYIEGDKNVPFYVKTGENMQPRYGKNHCIIPNLDPGVLHIEILFQQHAYPSTSFTINVPPGGGRGLQLTLKNGSYALFDLASNTYIYKDEK